MEKCIQDNAKIISLMTQFSLEAENIFCAEDLSSNGNKMLDLFKQLGFSETYLMLIEDEGKVSVLDGNTTSYLRSEHLLDCLPLLFKSAEPCKFNKKELQLFLKQVNPEKKEFDKYTGMYFGIEIREELCAFFVAIHDNISSENNDSIEIEDPDLKKNLNELLYLFELIISSLVHKKDGDNLKRSLEANRQQQSIWLESLDWLIKASSHLEETDYDGFYAEAIFQLSRLVNSDNCVIYRSNKENQSLSLLNDLSSSDFTTHVEELIESDIALVKGSFTEFHQSSGQNSPNYSFKHILLFPIFFGDELRMMVAIGKKDSDFDSNEVVFTGLFCDGIQRALERRNFIKSIRRQNEKLTQEKEEQKLLIHQLHETQDQLFQQEKMASIGQLAAGVAHEINNPVGYVSSNISSLEGYVDDMLSVFDFLDAILLSEPNYEELKERIEKIKDDLDVEFIKEDCGTLLSESKEGIIRVKEIVQDLKDFSHVDEATWQEADLVKGIESTLNIVANDLKYKAKITKEYGDIPLVTCVPPQINQVIMNLLVNAGHAIKEQGEIGIKSYRVNEDKVAIEISDTGSGISEENLNKIFDPFFTTKPVGTGTGLGLSLSYSIIEKHGGQLKCDSKVGVGTTFTIILPITRLNSETEN